MDSVGDLKLATTQNAIRNKFEKAYATRIEHEHNVDNAVKSIAGSSSSSSSQHAITDNLESTDNNNNKNVKTIGINKTNKVKSVQNDEETNSNPNVLCDDLKMHLKTLLDGDKNSMRSINAILKELHDLEIIV